MGKSESFYRAKHLEEMSFPSAWAGGNYSMRPGAFRCTGYHRTFPNMAMCATKPIAARASLSQNHARYLSQECGNHLLPKRRQVLSQIIPTCYNDGMVEWASVVWQNKWNRVRTDKYTSMDIDLKILVSLAGSLSKGMLEVSEISGDESKNTHFNLRLPSAEKHFCRRGSLWSHLADRFPPFPRIRQICSQEYQQVFTQRSGFSNSSESEIRCINNTRYANRPLLGLARRTHPQKICASAVSFRKRMAKDEGKFVSFRWGWFPGSMAIAVGSGVLTDMLVGDTDGSHRLFVLRKVAASLESERS